MSTSMADITVHIDEDLNQARRGDIEIRVRSLDGVMAFQNADKTPHLSVVKYDPIQVDSGEILSAVKSSGVRAELIGL